MVRLLAYLAATLLAFSATVFAQASNDDPRGKTLYVNAPSCDHWKCQVVWSPGQNVYVNWLNAPKGGLKIQLVPEEGTTGLKTYTITDKVGSIHGFSKHKCNDMGIGAKCGRFDWTVPANVREGKYEVVVTSLAQPKYVGYTDTVVIKKDANKKKGKRHAIERLLVADDQQQ